MGAPASECRDGRDKGQTALNARTHTESRSRVMTFTAQVFAYGVRVGWKGPFHLVPQVIEFKLTLGPDPRLPD